MEPRLGRGSDLYCWEAFIELHRRGGTELTDKNPVEPAEVRTSPAENWDLICMKNINIPSGKLT
jgi:hypothetical protein